MRVLDLFSGIGGFSLGLERAGFQTVAFCEIEPFCRAVLRNHWPEVPIYEDVRTLTADALERDGITDIDAICGGFPCQDLSYAGKRAGLEGDRSGLWSEIRRLAGELRPRFIVLENVPGLLSLGMGVVLGDLSALGYDAVWDCIPASAVGAPHRRDRVWIIAYARGQQHEGSGEAIRRATAAGLHNDFSNSKSGVRQRRAPRDERYSAQLCENVADATSERRGETGQHSFGGAQRASGGGEDVAHANNEGLEERQRAKCSNQRKNRQARARSVYENVSDAVSGGRQGPWLHEDASHSETSRPREAAEPVDGGGPGERGTERRLGGMVDGVPNWVDPSAWLEEPEGVPRVIKGQDHRASRLKALGNSIVPQVAEVIGRAILQAQGGDHLTDSCGWE